MVRVPGARKDKCEFRTHAHGGIRMIHFDDRKIDEILWSTIAKSDVAGYFSAYLQHRPEGASHLDKARERVREISTGPTRQTRQFQTAIEKIKSLADSGDPAALFHMGKFYANGTGVPSDGLKARQWYEKAIQAGELRACCNLGLMYLAGSGIEKNPRKGVQFPCWLIP